MPDLDLTLLDKFHLFHLNLSIQLDSLEGISTNDDETKINLKKKHSLLRTKLIYQVYNIPDIIPYTYRSYTV